MAADEYMRTRRTGVGIWLVTMASLETANGHENTVVLVEVLVERRTCQNARKALRWTKVTSGTRSYLTRKLKAWLFHWLLYRPS